MSVLVLTPDLVTGWFGRPSGKGTSARCAQVHVANPKSGRALCGYKPHPTMKFQWCAPGIVLHYIECPRCLTRAKTRMVKELRASIERIL